MQTPIERRPDHVSDHFAWVVGHTGLHGSIAEFVETERVLISLSRSLPPRAARGVRLGLVYAKRVHSEEPAQALLDELTTITKASRDDPEAYLLARIVEAVVLLLRLGRYRESLERLSQIQGEIKNESAGIAYGIMRRGMASAHMFLGHHVDAEVAFQDSITAFRRQDHALLLASASCDYAVLKKKLACYEDAQVLLKQALRLYDNANVVRGKIQAVVNQGIVEVRLGDWRAAEKFFRKAQAHLTSHGLHESDRTNTQLLNACKGKLEQLDLLRRRFDGLDVKFLTLLDAERDERVSAVLCEYISDLYVETGDYRKADMFLDRAYASAFRILPQSDVMTEILRRQAQLELCRANLDDSKAKAINCVQLARRIGDRYECGAATRVLGEVYAIKGDIARARACFVSSARMLKGIHECYELMRTLYAQGGFLSKHGKRDEAEISLLEARQLAKKLELEYYQTLIAVALVDALVPQKRWSEATSWLQEASTLRDNLEGVDLERVEKEVKRAANELQTAITRASVKEAETLKTICRAYEDARFPIVEMKPDLAYQIAQSAGAANLFVIGRKGGGFSVPITYNIAVNEAKEVVRRLDSTKKGVFLALAKEGVLHALPKGGTLVAVPCLVAPPNNERAKPREMYAFCSCFEQSDPITSRQMEILHASAEVLARLIEDEDERHAPPTDEELTRVRHPRGSFKDILTIDPGMIKLIKHAERAAASVAPILLEGETGVGKELFARAIHDASKRKEGPFVAVNAGGMPVTLLETELFGHVKGAFTDAGSDRQGFVDAARGGTLFLDEIGEMGEELQVKLLRLLENGEYRRLGETSMRQADVRVISATNKDLAKEVEHRRFRRDLFYRIAPLRLTIPPLRMRTSDIQLMVRHFLRDCAEMNGIGDRYIEIDVKAMEALELYDWPGNVRELFNEILRVVSLIGRGDLVKFNMLSGHIQEYLHASRRGSEGLLERSVEQFERRLILHALDRNDWNHLRTAESIGVPRTTLLAKLKRLNIPAKL